MTGALLKQSLHHSPPFLFPCQSPNWDHSLAEWWDKVFGENKYEQRVNEQIYSASAGHQLQIVECMRQILLLTEYNKANDVLWVLFCRNKSFFFFSHFHLPACWAASSYHRDMLTVYSPWVFVKRVFIAKTLTFQQNLHCVNIQQF